MLHFGGLSVCTQTVQVPEIRRFLILILISIRFINLVVKSIASKKQHTSKIIVNQNNNLIKRDGEREREREEVL
jgi:hypothetical protein